MRIFLLCSLLFSYLLAQTYSDSAFSANGEVKYKNFTSFDYVNPNAPKGGHIKQYALGSYDSFYDFLLKGTSAKGLSLEGFSPLAMVLKLNSTSKAVTSLPLLKCAFSSK